MSFTQAHRKEVEALLSKLTTTGDAVGRMARDIRLVLALNPEWDVGIVNVLSGVYNSFIAQLTVLAEAEKAVADILKTVDRDSRLEAGDVED